MLPTFKYKRVSFKDYAFLLFLCAAGAFFLVYGLSVRLLISLCPFVLVLTAGTLLHSRLRRRWFDVLVSVLLLVLSVPTLAALQGQYLLLYEKCSLDKYEIPWLFTLVFMLFVVLSVTIMVPYFLTDDIFLSDVLEGRFPLSFVLLLLFADGSAFFLSLAIWPVFWGAYGPQLMAKYPGVFYVGISVAPMQHYTLMLLLVTAMVLIAVMILWLLTLNGIEDGTALCLHKKSVAKK